MAYGELQWVTITMLLFWFLLLLLFVTFHVSVVYMCMVYVHVFVQMNIFLCVHTEGRKECQVFCSITFYSILLRQGVWLNLELGCQRDPLQLHSLMDWDNEQNTKENESWALEFFSLCFLTADAVWHAPAAISSSSGCTVSSTANQNTTSFPFSWYLF